MSLKKQSCIVNNRSQGNFITADILKGSSKLNGLVYYTPKLNGIGRPLLVCYKPIHPATAQNTTGKYNIMVITDIDKHT